MIKMRSDKCQKKCQTLYFSIMKNKPSMALQNIIFQAFEYVLPPDYYKILFKPFHKTMFLVINNHLSQLFVIPLAKFGQLLKKIFIHFLVTFLKR